MCGDNSLLRNEVSLILSKWRGHVFVDITRYYEMRSH